MRPYGAAYVALAERLDAELVTLDAKIETIPGLMCPVRNLRGVIPAADSTISDDLVRTLRDANQR